jgi:chromosome transmission fidelity protein 4
MSASAVEYGLMMFKLLYTDQQNFQGILRVFSSQFGGSWLPVFRYRILQVQHKKITNESHLATVYNFSSTKARKSEDESHWVVGLDANNIFCIICKSPESCPQVSFASL